MKHSQPITAVRLSLLFAAGLFLLSSAPLFAQPERRIVPRHDFAVELPELGRMVGLESDGLYGDKIYPLGPVDGLDTLCDWIVTRLNRDTAVDGWNPRELLLYKGTRGGVPDVSDRQVISVDPGTNVFFRGAGDFDNDQYIDLVTKLTDIVKDPETNPKGYGVSRVVVWWGNAEGVYSLEDTTQLHIISEAWLGPSGGIVRDWDHDGIDDLLMTGVVGFEKGEIDRRTPSTVLWRGSDVRWGTDEEPRWTWSWSDWPSFDYSQFVDQDSDGHVDLVFCTKGRGGGVHTTLSIIYGIPDHILDTANIVSISLDSAWGKYALFADITGDNVPELLVNTGGQEALKAYVGFKGQRLLEQYGLGNEPGHPGEEIWWGKPWATIPLPGQLHDGWAPSGWSPIYDWGDGGLDGVGDVWVFSVPDFICYNGGERFDSIYDGWIRRPGNWGKEAVALGDIDGSGLVTVAVGFGYTSGDQPDGISFVQPTKDLPSTGKYRYLPEGTGKPDSSVEEEVPSKPVTDLGLSIHPNPASGAIEIAWTSRQGRATIEITDQLGQEVTRVEAGASQGVVVWNASQTFGGTYFAILEIDGKTETTNISIQR